MNERPLIAVIGCNRMIDDEPAQMVKTRYLSAVTEEAGAVPLIVPSLARADDAIAIVPRVDAILLTGASSNVSPAAYGAVAGREPFDPGRDRASVALIRAARHLGVPVIGISRGLHEINVALGGSLADERDEGNNAHHAAADLNIEDMFAFSHEVIPAPASVYARIVGTDPVMVNSVHYQRIERLGDGLRVQATASDGVVEAIASREADPLIFAVQWQPEWHPRERKHDIAFWRWVGDAARRAAQRRIDGLPPGLL